MVAYESPPLNYTWDDIQTAIWTILFSQFQQGVPYGAYLTIDPMAPTYLSSNVYAILNDVTANTATITPETAYTIVTNGNMLMGDFMLPVSGSFQIISIVTYLCGCCDGNNTGPTGMTGLTGSTGMTGSTGNTGNTGPTGMLNLNQSSLQPPHWEQVQRVFQ